MSEPAHSLNPRERGVYGGERLGARSIGRTRAGRSGCGPARSTLRYLKNILLAVSCVWLIAPVAAAQVVINEIMYHPESADDGEEFIEIHNPGVSPVILTGWCFDGVLLCFTAGATIESPA